MVASVLTQLDLPDLVADSAADFVARAARLANDRAGLARLRTGLRGRMAGSPLIDGPAFARRLEAAYRRMWERWCAGSKGAGD